MEETLFGTKPVETLQALLPTLGQLFIFLTTLGGDIVFAALLGVTYWCFNKRAAVTALYVLLLSGYLHYFLKMGLKMERPPSEYRIYEKQDISYGFPSEHAQNTATFWSWVLLKIRKAWFRLLSITIVSAVGLSRVYLGVHYLGDVIGGIVIGVAFSASAFKIGRIASKRLKDYYKMLNQATPILAVFLLVLSLMIFPDVARGDPSAALGSLFGFLLRSDV
jgi:membrane-associated phospholipid phosphatase